MTKRGSKDKGSRFEKEFVDRMRDAGIPSTRVLGSGAFATAKSDVKIGVKLGPTGEYPAADESVAVERVECKNRADSKPLDEGDLVPVGQLLVREKQVPQRYLDFLTQDNISKFVALRFPIKRGATTAPVGIYMAFEDFVDLFKKAYPEVVWHESQNQ